MKDESMESEIRKSLMIPTGEILVALWEKKPFCKWVGNRTEVKKTVTMCTDDSTNKRKEAEGLWALAGRKSINIK